MGQKASVDLVLDCAEPAKAGRLLARSPRLPRVLHRHVVRGARPQEERSSPRAPRCSRTEGRQEPHASRHRRRRDRSRSRTTTSARAPGSTKATNTSATRCGCGCPIPRTTSSACAPASSGSGKNNEPISPFVEFSGEKATRSRSVQHPAHRCHRCANMTPPLSAGLGFSVGGDTGRKQAWS